MRTAHLRSVLLDALAAASAMQAGCAPSTQSPGKPPSVEVPAPVTAPSERAEPSSRLVASAAERPGPPAEPYRVPAELAAECAEGFRNVLRDLRPAEPIDYAELRQRQGEGQVKPIAVHGQVCARAADRAACESELGKATNAGFGSSCRPGHCDFHVVVTGPSGVRRFASAADLARFLAPVDTPGEALLLAFANAHSVLACDAAPPVRTGTTWTLKTNQMIEECPVVTADVTLSISEQGAVQVVGTSNRKKTAMCVGRRPPGLGAVQQPDCGFVASYLASAAHLEAASVAAFECLARELTRLGAPARLRRRCERAAGDERRHARVMKRLAARYEASVPKLALRDVALRDELALALDNAVEGCVRETFGAALGLYQARRAMDPRVRRALERIAEDETRHAALSWKIAAWLEPRLSLSQARSVEDARKRAIADLRRELRAEPPARARELLGLPDAPTALALCDRLEQTLWS